MARNKTVFQDSLRRAHNYAWDKQWGRAIAEYQRALEEFDNDPVVWVSLGVALVEAKRLAEAKAAYRRAGELEPGNLAVQQKLAEIYEGLGEIESALQVYLQLATALQKSDAPATAVEAWRSILRLQPSHLDSRMALADLLQQLDRDGEAAQENVTVARLLHERGRTVEAISRAREALMLDGRNGDARTLITAWQAEAPGGAEPAPSAQPSVLTDYESPLRVTAQQVVTRLTEQANERGQRSESDRLIAQAVEQQARGKLGEAVASFQRALASGAQPDIHFVLGALYIELHRDENALGEFLQTVLSPSLALGSHFALGKCYRARGQLDLALEHLLAVLAAVETQAAKPALAGALAQFYEGLLAMHRRSPGHEVGTVVDDLIAFESSKQWQQKVGSWRRQLDALADSGATLSVAELLHASDVDDVLNCLLDSQTYLQRHLFVAAVDECYRGITLAPTYVPLHERLAEIYSAQGRSDVAIAKYGVLAALQRARGELSQTAQTYGQMVKLRPQDVDVRARLVELLSESGKFAEAIEQSLALGQAHFQQAQPEAALRVYQAALRLIPLAGADRWTLTILHRMGEIYMQRVDWKDALSVYLQIRELSPADEKASLRLIELYFKQNSDPDMEEELDHFIAQHEQSGDLETLVPIVSDMVGVRPRSAALRRCLVNVLLKLDRTEQAISELDALGEIQLSAGLKREAMQTIAQIIALEPRTVDDYRALLAQLQAGP